MSLFEDFTKKVSETARVVGKKSSDLVEVTRLGMSIGTEESKIQKTYTEMGKAIYESFSRGEPVAESFLEYCQKIKTFEETIDELKQRINTLKKVKYCPECAAELDQDICYCPWCGAKQEMPKPPEEESKPVEKHCAACNTSNSLDANFCFKCGSKLE